MIYALTAVAGFLVGLLVNARRGGMPIPGDAITQALDLIDDARTIRDPDVIRAARDNLGAVIEAELDE